MDKLQRKRQTLKGILTRIYNACVQTDITGDEIKVRVEKAEETFKEYEKIQDEIDDVTPVEEQEKEEKYRTDMEDKYFAIKSIHSRIIDDDIRNVTVVENQQPPTFDMPSAIQTLMEHQGTMGELVERISRNTLSSSTPTNNVQHEHANHEFRLQRIQVPEFNGECTEWIRFRDLFEALVHNKNNVSNVEKLEYLQTKVQGEAQLLIKHLRPSNANYEIAWQMLKQKYDKSDKVKRAYLELLFDQPAMKMSSVVETKRVYNNINESIKALEVLNQPVQHWNEIVLFHIERKLDMETLRLWYRGKNNEEDATIQQLVNFLEKRVFELEHTQPNVNTAENQYKSDKLRRNQARAFTAVVRTCPCCSNEHSLYRCEQFLGLNVNDRRQLVQQRNLCFNCLQPNHRAAVCESSTCRKCNMKHNTLLHIVDSMKQTSNVVTDDTINEMSCTNETRPAQPLRTMTMLPTAIIMVQDRFDRLQPCRALLDSGSQSTIIAEACVQRLQLKRTHDQTVLFGVGAMEGSRTRGRVAITIVTTTNDSVITTHALCLSTVTQQLPPCKVNDTKLKYFNHLQFADVSYMNPSGIDLILGADVFSDCMLPGKITHPSGSPTAIQTIFGWVLMGKVINRNQQHVLAAHTHIDLDQQLQKFWIIEDIQNQKKHLTPEEQQAEQHYQKHVQRDKNGRYIVRLPLKNDINLGDSREAALRRLISMERRFVTNKEFKMGYNNFMHEYFELQHLERSDNSSPAYYLPHHAVLKPTSTTTKLRVVFDASCKSTNGLSLNDQLLVGPNVQRDLFDIIVCFRKFRIGFVSDIEKMYRQILIHESDRPLQRIVWRFSENEQPRDYNLKTVTYGTAAAPFLATRTLQQIAIDNNEQHPEAAASIAQNFYVDDFMGGAEDDDGAIILKNDISHILSSSGMHLRKWCSNSKRFLESVKEQDRESSIDTEINESHPVKTLGLLWDTTTDSFKFSVTFEPLQHMTTKRSILSHIARIFDPIGWLAPVVVSMKVLMQKLWLRRVGWDEELPDDLCKEWNEHVQNLGTMIDLRIPRWIQYATATYCEIHGFADSSELAYAAAIYLRVQLDSGEVLTHLIAAKTRVAPVKQVTLPRLELCAAHLMTKLITKVQNALNLPEAQLFGWTDSTIVLAWISDHPRRWKTFVANRTAEIIETVPASRWRHIRSQCNPADLATRGISAENLLNNQLWWLGPDELRHYSDHEVPPICMEIDLEERVHVTICNATTESVGITERYSNYSHLLRITALLLRFKQNSQSRKLNLVKSTAHLTTEELQRAHKTLIKLSQFCSFSAELKLLRLGKQLPSKHKLAPLAPFVDDMGLLRVGGRISNANINYDQKHPIILHKDHHLTKLIVNHYHIKYLHAGNRQLQYLLGLRYWIPSAVQVIKQCVYKCTACMRQRGIAYHQQMGNIPQHRLVPGHAFLNTGVDFAGPIQVKSWKGRGSRLYKSWIALYVCLVTKATHLELVTELSTAAFVASLRRFIARRGKPIHIYSDNGTNFVGANQYLRGIYELLNTTATQDAITRELVDQEIQWHYSPPSGPHFGGLWEAGVKAAKHHLKRVLGETSMTYEELSTTLCQIEGCLNSRPLCLKFQGDLDPLTPAHFLILRPMSMLPDEDLINVRETALNRWQYLQRLVQTFWKKWSTEYLTQLQHRPKWTHKMANLQLNDIVIIKDDTSPPSHWLIGKVLEVHPGPDGLVRVATIKTIKGIFKRPIVKLCPLFLDVEREPFQEAAECSTLTYK